VRLAVLEALNANLESVISQVVPWRFQILGQMNVYSTMPPVGGAVMNRHFKPSSTIMQGS
jgi:hypothetical protein